LQYNGNITIIFPVQLRLLWILFSPFFRLHSGSTLSALLRYSIFDLHLMSNKDRMMQHDALIARSPNAALCPYQTTDWDWDWTGI